MCESRRDSKRRLDSPPNRLERRIQVNERKAKLRRPVVDVDLRRDACEFGRVTRPCFVMSFQMLATQKNPPDAYDVISGDAHLLGRPTLTESGRPSDRPLPIIGSKDQALAPPFPHKCEG